MSDQNVNIYDENCKIIYVIKPAEPTSTTTRSRALKYIEDNKSRGNCRSKRRKELATSMAQLSLTTKDDVFMEIHHLEKREIKKMCTNPLLLLQKATTEVPQTILSQQPLTPLSSPMSPLPTFSSIPTIPSLPMLLLEEQQQSSFVSPLSPPPDPPHFLPISTIPSTIPSSSSISLSTTAPLTMPSSTTHTSSIQTVPLDQFLLDASPTVEHPKISKRKDSCQICNKEDGADTWIGCNNSKCDFWAHAICLGWQIDYFEDFEKLIKKKKN